MNGEDKMRGQSIGLLTMLAVEFVLGMILNLFVTLPKVHPGTTGGFAIRALQSFGWAITNGGGIALLLHVLVAVGLIIGSIMLIVRAAAAKSRYWLIVSTIGAFGILVALTNGLTFLGYDSDASSFVMAIGFIVASVTYTTAIAYAPEPSPMEDHAQPHREPKLSGRYKPSHT